MMRGHLQCRDTLAGNQGCPLKTGTTVIDGLAACVIFSRGTHKVRNNLRSIFNYLF